MSELWILVADQSRARFFTLSESHSTLLDAGELEHPQARELEQALTSDKPGRSFDSAGQGRHAMGSAVEPGEQETLRFAKQVAGHVKAAHNKGQYDRLLLVAGPPMLGLLRDNLKSLPNLQISEIEKNLGQYDALEIRKHLPNRL